MIDPTESDVGREVTYTGNRYPGGELEYGVITSFNGAAVFVRYGSEKHSKATSREDLEWSHPKGVYGEWCRDPKLCAGKGYCPRDPNCGD